MTTYTSAQIDEMIDLLCEHRTWLTLKAADMLRALKLENECDACGDRKANQRKALHVWRQWQDV